MPSPINVEEILLKELMEDSPDYIFIKDRQSRFVVTNKAHSRLLLGLENPQDAVGKTDFDLFPGKLEDAKRFFAEEQFIMETGQPVIYRQWMAPSAATGEIVWLSESKLPIRDNAGEIIGIIGLGRDITIQKKEQLLREKLSRQLETAVQVARIVSGILDPQELAWQIVNLLHDRFDFYYVGLFLVEQTRKLYSAFGEYAILRAATGETGQKLLSQMHKIKVGDNSLVGQCISTGKPLMRQSAKGEKFENDLRAEIALPLIIRQEAVGALNIQSKPEVDFNEQDLSVFEVLASLLATSIQNAFLFKKLDEDLTVTKQELQLYVRESWSKYRKSE
ncbi:MAG: PAS domain-containing protein [Chloroflexi bacterium]|nr:PAS domain-containing protein [Chloroflexota bacterium]